MNVFPKRSPSYGEFLRPVQRAAALLLIFAGILGPIGALAADKPVKIVVLGDSLSAGYGLNVQDAFPSKLQAALKAKGYHYQYVYALDSGHCDRKVREQTLPQALEWVWK